VVDDDQRAPDRAIATVRRLVDRENVFMLHGGSCSGSTLAVKDFVIESKVPHLVLAAAARALVEPVNPYLFTVTQDLRSQATTMLNYILSMPDARKIAVVHHPDEWGHEQADPFLAGLKAAGVTPVAVEVLDRNAADATAQIQRVRSAGADVVALFAQPGETSVFLRDANRYGYFPVTFGTGGGMDLHNLAERAGGYDVIKNYRVVSYLKGYLGSEEIAAGEALYTKWFPEPKPLALTFIGMGGARAVVEALERAGPELTREKFLKAMESLQDYDNGVNSCLFSYSATDHIACESGTIWKIQNEKIVTLGPKWQAEHDAD
jgi:branched-chain amino acid transport system substrate-binding protein